MKKLIGDTENPYAHGKLCARGYAYSQIAYSEDRLTDPLKKNGKGTFEAITWDQAFQEIGEKVQKIISTSGADSLAMIQDPRPSGQYYAKRFINALDRPTAIRTVPPATFPRNRAARRPSVRRHGRRMWPTRR